MIYLAIFLTIVALTLTQFGLLLSMYKPLLVNHILDVPKSSNVPRYIFGICILVFFFLLFYFLKDLSSPHPMQVNDYMAQTNFPPANPNIYTQLRVENYDNIQNLYYLYQGRDISEQTLDTLAHYIKQNICVKPCTINFYDDKRAFDLDEYRKTITDSTVMENWNRKNYVFVADHYLGYLGSDKYPSFSYFPYRDWYYQSLKNK